MYVVYKNVELQNERKEKNNTVGYSTQVIALAFALRTWSRRCTPLPELPPRTSGSSGGRPRSPRRAGAAPVDS